MSPDPPTSSAAAADPNTPAETLAWIAQSRPDLHAALASNPGLYPELRQWLGQSPDPAVQQALQQFAQAQALAMTPLATQLQQPDSAAAQPGAVGMEPPLAPTVGGGGSVGATGAGKAGRTKIALWILGGIAVCAAVVGGVLYWHHTSSPDTNEESGTGSQSTESADAQAPKEPSTPPEEPSAEQAAEPDNNSEINPVEEVEEVVAEPSWADLDGRWVSSDPAEPGTAEFSEGGRRIVYDNGFANETNLWEAYGECFSGLLGEVDAPGGSGIIYCPAGAEAPSTSGYTLQDSDPARDRWSEGQDMYPTVWYRE